LRADAERVHFLEELEAEFFRARLRAARLELLDVDRRHQRLLRHEHRLLRRTADADAEHPGGHQPAPICGTVFSTHSTSESEGLSIANFDFASDPPPFAAQVTSTCSPGTISKWITAGVLSFVLLRAPAGSASTEARSLLCGSRYARRTPSLIMSATLIVALSQRTFHPDLDEDHGDAGVLADRSMTLGGHARIREDLRDCILRSRRLLALVGVAERADVVERMVVADVLEGVGDALDQVFLADRGHDGSIGISGGQHSRRLPDPSNAPKVFVPPKKNRSLT